MSLVRNTAVQASLTFASRILGFARDIILAAKIGAGPVGLVAALDQAEADPEIRAVILTGVGTKAFCAGGDVRALAQACRACSRAWVCRPTRPTWTASRSATTPCCMCR